MQEQLLSPEYQDLTQSTTVPTVDLSILEPILWVSAAVTILFTVLFLIYVIYSFARRYKVEKATLEMQKDIRRLRELAEQQAEKSSRPTAAPRPAHDVIAAHDTATDTTPSTDTVT